MSLQEAIIELDQEVHKLGAEAGQRVSELVTTIKSLVVGVEPEVKEQVEQDATTVGNQVKADETEVEQDVAADGVAASTNHEQSEAAPETPQA